jgi:hypothetical protein
LKDIWATKRLLLYSPCLRILQIKKVKCVKKPNQELKFSLGQKQKMFSTSQDENLVKILNKLEGRLFALTSKEFRNLALNC